MLTIYRRHLKSCKHGSEGRSYRRCKCPIWVDGSLDGHEMRKSLETRDWQKASDRVREWEANGTIAPEAKKDEPITITAAWEAFVRDAESRGLQPDSVRKYRHLKRVTLEFAVREGLRYLSEFDVAKCRDFRSTWTVKNASARKRLEYLRSFFRFAQESGWIAQNPAKALKPPKITDPPTMPFSRPEIEALLTAAPNLEVKALILLLRYSGLRIGDAVTLSSERIQDGKLLLRTAKTNVMVYVPLPDFAIAALDAVRRRNGYYFWSGTSRKSSVCDTWRKRLAPVFEAAAIPDGHPHRFRDTFAIELLLAGVPLERVSVLLGHSSVKVTEKHYAPWVLDRQQQLEEDVRRTWAQPETKGTPGVHGGKALVN
jgi:integrase/recombinase XerD